eukprot:CAMPEP_0182437920 /NCGR_PEP_ID=MMETSP1167-20130531/85373_1 /TAXON_ID=2988 /ORGANISM="Mallomonas Sp, Strain CCMP3275" /LENGTH=313 /DNA_ID=CAMNT_0024631011 /DNA_START=1226 /DNA_END=2164 /DNA_ORIENTATION=+
MRYPTADRDVLRNVSFIVKGGSKVGIVGRTGAGKSSLISALFRTVEPLPGSEVLVDGVNLLSLPLHTVRSNLAIVPQSPVLFNGSIRSNLDPFNTVTDEEIWEALEKVHMAEHVAQMSCLSSLPSVSYGSSSDMSLLHSDSDAENGGREKEKERERESGSESEVGWRRGMSSMKLEDKPVLSGGSNFSVGQRQLLCLARAAIRKTRVLVLDEATANVDPHTDELIQEAVQKQFQGVTVLSIAHRLRTVVACDLVLVLEDGQVQELDSPQKLLETPGSAFLAMCERTGEVEELKRLVEISVQNKIYQNNIVSSD